MEGERKWEIIMGAWSVGKTPYNRTAAAWQLSTLKMKNMCESRSSEISVNGAMTVTFCPVTITIGDAMLRFAPCAQDS